MQLSNGNASTAGGLDVVRRVLREAGRDPQRGRLVDGSGLSRMDLIAAADLVALLRNTAMRDPTFVELLPAMGRHGTLRTRLVGTGAEAVVHAKTGALTGHRTLVGVVDHPNGSRAYFAVMVDGTPWGRAQVDVAVDTWLEQWVRATSSSSTSSPAPRISSALPP